MGPLARRQGSAFSTTDFLTTGSTFSMPGIHFLDERSRLFDDRGPLSRRQGATLSTTGVRFLDDRGPLSRRQGSALSTEIGSLSRRDRCTFSTTGSTLSTTGIHSLDDSCPPSGRQAAFSTTGVHFLDEVGPLLTRWVLLLYGMGPPSRRDGSSFSTRWVLLLDEMGPLFSTRWSSFLKRWVLFPDEMNPLSRRENPLSRGLRQRVGRLTSACTRPPATSAPRATASGNALRSTACRGGG